jgi:hypothetical protein
MLLVSSFRARAWRALGSVHHIMIAINVSKMVTPLSHARAIRELVWGIQDFDNMNIMAATRTEVRSL